MKKELLAAGFVLFAFMLPSKASAAQFSKFFVFGDSLSDNGNTFNFTGGSVNPAKAFPPDPPFFQGRFSNGENWVDYAGKNLGLTPTLVSTLPQDFTAIPPNQGINFAFGGSLSGTDNAFIPGAPGVLAQVGFFTQSLQANNQKADPNALYSVWGGGNDYLFGKAPDPNQTVKNLSDAVAALAQAGAKNIAVFNLSDLGKLPLASRTGNSAALTGLTQAHNAALSAALGQLSFSNPGVNIIPVDINSLFNTVQANPGKFGFQDVTGSCVIGDFQNIVSVCNNPNDFLFFDAVHPTTNAYKLIADTALSAINAKSGKSVPEPSAALGLVAFGALGAAGVLKRKRTKQLSMSNEQ